MMILDMLLLIVYLLLLCSHHWITMGPAAKIIKCFYIKNKLLFLLFIHKYFYTINKRWIRYIRYSLLSRNKHALLIKRIWNNYSICVCLIWDNVGIYFMYIFYQFQMCIFELVGKLKFERHLLWQHLS